MSTVIERHNPIDAMMSKAAKVRQSFKVGRPHAKDRVWHPLVSIGVTCELLDELRDKMRTAGLSAEDVRAALVWRTPTDEVDATYYRWMPAPEKLPDLAARLLVPNSKPLMLGIMFEQADYETQKVSVWVHPFLTGPEAKTALIEARKRYIAGCGVGPSNSLFSPKSNPEGREYEHRN